MKFRVPHPLWILAAAVVLGLTAVGMNVGITVHRQQTAIATIQRLEGIVETQPAGPEWMHEWLGDSLSEHLVTVVGFNLDGSAATDEDLDKICVLTNLEFGILSRTNITNAGLQRLERLPRLRMLSLDHTNVSDDGVENLMDLVNLEELSLGGTTITDVGLSQLATLPSLQELSIWRTGISDAGVVEVRRSVPQLKIYR